MSKDAKKKDVTKIKRDFDAQVLDMYGHDAQVQPRENAMARALQRFAEEGDATAVAHLNRIFKEEERKPMTLAIACAEALGGAYEDEKGMAMDTRMERFKLSQRILEGGIVELTTEERDKIKALLTKRFPGSVIAPRCAILLETEPEVASESPPPADDVASTTKPASETTT